MSTNTFYNPKPQYNFMFSSDNVEKIGDRFSCSFPTINLPSSFSKEQLWEMVVTDVSLINYSNLLYPFNLQIKIDESDLTEFHGSSGNTASPYISILLAENRTISDYRADRTPSSRYLFYLDGRNQITFNLRVAKPENNTPHSFVDLLFDWSISFYIRPVN